MICKKVQITLSAYLDSEAASADWSRAKAHLQHCQACSNLFAVFKQQTRSVRSSLSEAEPSPALWSRIESEITSGPQLKPRPFLGFRLHWPLTVAALLVLVFLVGRWQGAVPPARESPPLSTASLPQKPLLQSRLNTFLNGSDMLLMEVKNSNHPWHAHEMDYARGRAQLLLQQTSFLKNDLHRRDAEALLLLVGQIELVLLEIANMEEADLEDFPILQKDLQERDILGRVGLFQPKIFELLPKEPEPMENTLY